MTQRTAERVLEISYSTGTGPIRLMRPVLGYRSLAEAGFVNGDTVDLMIESVSSNGAPTGDWEIGTYTWGTGSVLTRSTIVSSSNGGAAVDWTNGTRWVRARPGGVPDGTGGGSGGNSGGGSLPSTTLSNVQSDVQGRMISYTLGGIAKTVTYGAYGIDKITGSDGSVETYSYAADGTLTGVVSTNVAVGVPSGVTYDSQGRVTGYTTLGVAYTVTYGTYGVNTVSGGGKVTTYSYDGSGNFTGAATA